jgi:hypothetical protein
MKRTIVAVVICALAGVPAMAQEIASPAPHLTLGGIALNRALEAPSIAIAQAPATTPSEAAPREGKPLYIISLAAAGAGVIYNIHTTREALDRHLGARTFPLVWKTTRDPADKGNLTGIIAGLNGGLMAVSGIVFAKRHSGLATAINVMVAVATTGVSLRNRSIISDDKKLNP